MSADPTLMRRTVRHPGGSNGAVRAGRVSWRVVALAGRAEAARLCRSPLVLTGLAVAASLIWWNSRTMVPQWWVWDVQIGSILLTVAGAVLVSAQFAAGRIRRDGATQLYDSYPATAAARSGAYLLGAAGPLVLAVALTGAAVIWLDLLGPVGAPRPAVLAQGLLLVALGGAIGVALGRWLPHPMAGILAVIVLGAAEADLLLPFSGPVHLPGQTAWLFPWTQPVVLRWLPGPTPLIPPTAHLAWLAALTALGVLAALWRSARGHRLPKLTGLTALAAAGCLALAGWSGWAQTRPDAGAQESLAYQATHPAQSEQCTSLQRVRYCAYPGFSHDVARWAAVVNGVAGRLPARPAETLVVRQLVDVDYVQPNFADGYPSAAAAQDGSGLQLSANIARFVFAEDGDPHLISGSSVPPVYVDINWGAGSTASSYQLVLAMQAAWWIAGLPTTWQRSVSYSCGPDCSTQAQISCLPVGQAREAIALWLAATATPATRPAFFSWLRNGPSAEKVGHVWISAYGDASAYGYQPALQFTSQGAALARVMLRLPEQRVTAALATGWPRWLNPRATDAQLAAALGIQLPAVIPPPGGSALNRGQPADPVCR